MQNWIEHLNTIDGIYAHQNHTMLQHTPLRTGGPVECWIRCEHLEGFLKALPLIRRQNWRFHWPFEDWLVRDHGIQGCIVRLEGAFEEIHVQTKHIQMGVSALWSELSSIAECDHPLQSLAQELQLWPGSVGELLFSDDAAKKLANLEIEIDWIKGRQIQTMHFAPKTPVELPKSALPIQIRLYNTRRKKVSAPFSNGRIFLLDGKFPTQYTLQELQLDSVRLRDWKVSNEYPNHIVHCGSSSIDDLKLLQKALNQRIQPARNSTLQLRVPLLGQKQPFGNHKN